MNESEILMRVLSSMYSQEELYSYYQLFKKTPKGKFAVIKISGNTISKKVEIIAENLAILSKLGLSPIIVHGGGDQIDKAMKKRGLEIKKINGLRVTDEKTIKVIEKACNNITESLVESINKKGGKAINANNFGIIECQKLITEGEELGFVGEVSKVDYKKITSLCRAGYIPVIYSLGKNQNVTYNINADNVASAIAKCIRPKKLILITEKGGVLDKNGKIISAIDVQNELPQLIDEGIITEGMLVKINEIKKLLKEVSTMSVQVCSAENLLNELFTIKGNGTFIKCGTNFKIQHNYSKLSFKKLKLLIESSFDKNLTEDYFKEKIDRIILDKDYHAVAIVKKINKVAYLDKFAVEKKYSGNGLGSTIWHILKKLYPQLIWRASNYNTINKWYFTKCTGCKKTQNWTIFWYNLDEKEAGKLIPIIEKLPKTLVKKK